MLLGLTLLLGNEDLFVGLSQIMKDPPSVDFMSAHDQSNISEVQQLMGLTLMCQVLLQNIEVIEVTLQFGQKHKYYLGVTEEVCKYILAKGMSNQPQTIEVWKTLMRRKAVLRQGCERVLSGQELALVEQKELDGE